jgi:hypothetical protein
MFGFLTEKKVPKKKVPKKKAPRAPGVMKTVGKKHEVFAGTAHHTKGGLTRKDLTRSKSGKIVSKKQQAHGHRIMNKHPHVKSMFYMHRAPPFEPDHRV